MSERCIRCDCLERRVKDLEEKLRAAEKSEEKLCNKYLGMSRGLGPFFCQPEAGHPGFCSPFYKSEPAPQPAQDCPDCLGSGVVWEDPGSPKPPCPRCNQQPKEAQASPEDGIDGYVPRNRKFVKASPAQARHKTDITGTAHFDEAQLAQASGWDKTPLRPEELLDVQEAQATSEGSRKWKRQEACPECDGDGCAACQPTAGAEQDAPDDDPLQMIRKRSQISLDAVKGSITLPIADVTWLMNEIELYRERKKRPAEQDADTLEQAVWEFYKRDWSGINFAYNFSQHLEDLVLEFAAAFSRSQNAKLQSSYARLLAEHEREESLNGQINKCISDLQDENAQLREELASEQKAHRKMFDLAYHHQEHAKTAEAALSEARAELEKRDGLLRWLDRRGGLGLDVHERIRILLGKEGE